MTFDLMIIRMDNKSIGFGVGFGDRDRLSPLTLSAPMTSYFLSFGIERRGHYPNLSISSESRSVF